jgi:hypothetical protein
MIFRSCLGRWWALKLTSRPRYWFEGWHGERSIPTCPKGQGANCHCPFGQVQMGISKLQMDRKGSHFEEFEARIWDHSAAFSFFVRRFFSLQDAVNRSDSNKIFYAQDIDFARI